MVRPFVEARPAALTPPAKVEVAVEVEVIEPVVSIPVVSDEKMEETLRKMFAKSEVVVALVAERLTKVLVAVEVAVKEPMVREPILEEATYSWVAYNVPVVVALTPISPPLNI